MAATGRPRWLRLIEIAGYAVSALPYGLAVGALIRGETGGLGWLFVGVSPLLGFWLYIVLGETRAKRNLKRLQEAMRRERLGPLLSSKGSEGWLSPEGLYRADGCLERWSEFARFSLDAAAPGAHRLILWPGRGFGAEGRRAVWIFVVAVYAGAILEGVTAAACFRRTGATNDTLAAAALCAAYLLLAPYWVIRGWPGLTPHPENQPPRVALVNPDCATRDQLAALVGNNLPFCEAPPPPGAGTTGRGDEPTP